LREQKLPPEYSNQARKYLESLDKKAQQRLKDAIEKIPKGEIMPDDLYYIELAEKEYANGETVNHNDIKWKQ